MIESASPAMAAYEEISPLRDKHASVIWGDNEASPTELREILVDLDTGGTGQPGLFDLPGGGRARVCVKRDTYPDGTTFVGTGIVPDVQVQMKIEDVREGKDPVLNRAVLEVSDKVMRSPGLRN